MGNEAKLKRCVRILKCGEFLIASVRSLGEGKFYCNSVMSENNKVLGEVMDQVMLEHKEIRDFFLERVLNFLRRRETDTKIFLEQLNK